MAKSQPLREDLKQYKETLRSHAKELRVLARRLGHDRKLQDLVERAAECAEDARDSIKLGRAPRHKAQPYEPFPYTPGVGGLTGSRGCLHR